MKFMKFYHGLEFAPFWDLQDHSGQEFWPCFTRMKELKI